MSGRMQWPAGWAVVCCARVGDPHWRTTGGEEVQKSCRCCGAALVVEVAMIERANEAFGTRWDFACVDCYRTNRAPVEIWGFSR